MKLRSVALSLLSASFFLSGSLPAGDTAEARIPSYAEALSAFRAAKEAQASPALTEQDRAVMAKAKDDLAAALPNPGLAVGTAAPDFSLTNANGTRVGLSSLLAEGPVVLTFYRGAWCPYCNLQLRGLTQSLPMIEAQGARLVAVTPQTPDKSLAQVEEDGFPFEILSDLDDSVTKAYGLYFEVPAALRQVYEQRLGLDITAYNGAGRHGLPVPGTFVIDRGGVIRAAFADVDDRQRMEPADIGAALQRLPKQ